MSTNCPPLGLIASGYDIRVTIVQVVGNFWRQILAADPERWYLSFSNPAGSTWTVSPKNVDPTIQDYGVQIPAGLILDYKFRDCPPLVQSEWYANDQASGGPLTIIEVFYGR